MNSLTISDSYPIHWIDDCVDYWQIPLSDHDQAKEISAFVTPFGFYQYIGMKNSQATFEGLMNKIISALEGCEWCNHL